MIKKSLLIAGLSLVSLSANAWWNPLANAVGLVGISGGYATHRGDLNNNITFGFPTDLFPSPGTITFDTSLHDHGYFAGVFVGFEAVCNHWLWGLELNYDRQDIDGDHSFQILSDSTSAAFNVHTRYKRKNMFGLSGRLGWAWPSLVAYARLGVEIGRDKLESSFVFDALNGEVIERKRWDGHAFVGGGIEIPFFGYRGIKTRVEYNYHAKGQMLTAQEVNPSLTIGTTTNGNSGPVPATGSILFQNNFKPQEHTVKVSLVWK